MPAPRSLDSPASPSGGATAGHSDYRHDIEGLRGFAVLNVIAFHYGATTILPGGFTTLDIFFVLSGFLITSNLRRDIELGKFSLLTFYDRRIRRIVPALLLVLTVTLVAGWFLLMPGDYASLGESTAYAAFGLGNLFFYAHTGYFDRVAEMQPLLHTWSLGVEEQYYFAWPLLLWAGLSIVRSERVFRWLFAIAVAMAFAYAVYETASDPKGAYYLVHARAWELGAGGLIVFLPTVARRWVIPLEIVGVALLAWGLFMIHESDPFPGANALFPCVGAGLLVWPKAATGPVARMIAIRPLRWTGWISYSLYLWHWPLLVLFRNYNEGNAPSPAEAALLVVVTFGLSYLSWRFVEMPIRSLRPIRWNAVAAGVTACAAVVLLANVVRVEEGFTQRISPEIEQMRSLEVMWSWDCPRMLKLDELPRTFCNFGAPWDGAANRALLWGDSHAEHMAPMVEAAAQGLPIAFLLHSGCPAAYGGRAQRIRTDISNYPQVCTDERQAMVRLLQDDPRIDLVIVSSAWSNLAPITSQDGTIQGEPDGAKIIAAGLDDLIAQTDTPSRRFIIIADVPQFSHDPIPCAVDRQLGLLRRGCPPDQQLVSMQFFKQHHGETYEELTALAARYPNVSIVRPGDALCEGDWCQAYLDGEFLYRDGSHLRRNLAPQTRADFASLIGLTSKLRAAVDVQTATALTNRMP